MKALFWKEFRENLKWAILAMGIIIAAMAYSLRYNPNEFYSFQREVWQGLQSSQFLMVTVFGFPVVGLALGFLQILTELRRDQWAFLVHRPVTRKQVFWGKAIPGGILYLLATGIPLAGTAWWLATPGNMPAPFDIRQLLPGTVDLLTGLCFYFAALLSGIIQGPWYGRRALPLVATCFAATCAKVYSFPMATSGVALVLICILLAAAATHGAAGIFRRTSGIGRAALVLTYLFAINVLLGWFWVGWDIVFPGKPYSYKDYALFKTGEVVVTTREANWYKNVVTLDGREIKPEKSSFDWQDFLNASYLYLKPYTYYSNYRETQRLFNQIYTNSSSPYLWYYVRSVGSFQAFSMIGKSCHGFLGPDGFAPENDPAKAGSFQLLRSSYGTDDIVATEDGVYLPDLNAETIKKIFSLGPDEKMRSATIIYNRSNNDAPKDYAIATSRFIYILPHDGPRIQIPISVDPEKFQGLELYRTSEGYTLIYSTWWGDGKIGPELVKVSPQGAIVSQTSLPQLRQTYERTWRMWVSDALNPLGARLWNQANIWAFHGLGFSDSTPIWTWKAKDRNKALIYWMVATIVGLVCAGAVQVPLRRTEFKGQRLGWTLFVFFFSLGGLLAFWIANDWPRRIACPACGRKRSVERETCEHCGAGWPAPKQDGTEIWEGLTEEATPPAAR
ncbi:MAG: hypothetical protein BGO12_01210 [Verrucomicrobia bacterium 61-8]|nr:hypothetical protein [Verrucomicrobiota bacterium]OJV01975.1 MAG: hypothetical protein BGO12_01210 [Verrucomicrobia bacterium 61-8]